MTDHNYEANISSYMMETKYDDSTQSKMYEAENFIFDLLLQ